MLQCNMLVNTPLLSVQVVNSSVGSKVDASTQVDFDTQRSTVQVKTVYISVTISD